MQLRFLAPAGVSGERDGAKVVAEQPVERVAPLPHRCALATRKERKSLAWPLRSQFELSTC